MRVKSRPILKSLLTHTYLQFALSKQKNQCTSLSLLVPCDLQARLFVLTFSPLPVFHFTHSFFQYYSVTCLIRMLFLWKLFFPLLPSTQPVLLPSHQWVLSFPMPTHFTDTWYFDLLIRHWILSRKSSLTSRQRGPLLWLASFFDLSERKGNSRVHFSSTFTFTFSSTFRVCSMCFSSMCVCLCMCVSVSVCLPLLSVMGASCNHLLGSKKKETRIKGKASFMSPRDLFVVAHET